MKKITKYLYFASVVAMIASLWLFAFQFNIYGGMMMTAAWLLWAMGILNI